MELYTSPSRYHTIDETVRLWNGFLPRDDESKKVVHAVPRLSKDEVALLEAMKTEAKPPPSPPPSPPSPPSVPCRVDMDSSWLYMYGFV